MARVLIGYRREGPIAKSSEKVGMGPRGALIRGRSRRRRSVFHPRAQSQCRALGGGVVRSLGYGVADWLLPYRDKESGALLVPGEEGHEGSSARPDGPGSIGNRAWLHAHVGGVWERRRGGQRVDNPSGP
jgi:hypothetical protein